MAGLTKDMRSMLLMSVSGQIVSVYINIFINLYIWEGHKSLFDVAWYNLFMFLVWGASFVMGAHLLMRHTIRLVFTLSGIAGLGLFVLLSVMPNGHGLPSITLAGACAGLTFGFYMSGINFSQSLARDAGVYGAYFAAATAWQQVASFAVPLAAALVIQWFGYGASFVLMLVVVACMIAVSFALPSFTLGEAVKVEGPWYKEIGYRQMFPTKSARWFLSAILATGLFFQFQNLFLVVFTFQVSENKLIVGVLNCGYTLCALLALYAYRRLRRSADTWMLIGLAFSALGFVVALARTTPLFIASNILSSVGMFFFVTQWHTRVYRTIHEMTPMNKMRMLIWRELALVGSRCVMLLVLLGIRDINGSAFGILVGMTVLCMSFILLSFRRSAESPHSKAA